MKRKLPNSDNFGGTHNANTIGNVGGMQNANTNYSKVNGSWNHKEVVNKMEWISRSKVFKPHVKKAASEYRWNREGNLDATQPIETSNQFTSSKSMMLEEEELDKVSTTPCELVNNGKKFDSLLDGNNVNKLGATQAWMRNNTNIKDLEELDMPKQYGNSHKLKELARKTDYELGKI